MEGLSGRLRKIRSWYNEPDDFSAVCNLLDVNIAAAPVVPVDRTHD